MISGARRAAIFVALAISMIGCSRTYFRAAADRDVYNIEREREVDPRWRLPARPVEADVRSRIGDPFDPDREPVPLDDGAARLFQATNGRTFEFHKWEKRGIAEVERDDWRLNVATDPDGNITLSRESVVRLALFNSREYQTQVENVYLTALQLTLARYEFYLQPFARQGTFFNQLGGGASAKNQLQLNQGAGFSQNFASGGQLLVDFANAMVFEFNGKGFSAVTSNLAVAFSQPLIRGAHAIYRTQALSLQERQTLYNVRDFAHFRRQFYVDVAAAGGFLGLLQQVQSIRNQEEQVQNLARNLAEQEELAKAGAISLKDRDAIAQQYQSAQFSLIQLQAGLETSLDFYKIQLGLPPEIALKIDDSPLKVFELNALALDDLQAKSETLYLSLVQPDLPPPNPVLREGAETLKGHFAKLTTVLDQAETELATWRERLGHLDDNGEELPLPPNVPFDDPDEARQSELAYRLRKDLLETRETIAANLEDLEKLVLRFEIGDPKKNWEDLRELIGKQFRGRLSDILVAQAQVRVHLIELPEIGLSSEEAVKIGLQNRLDLMNARAQVTDSWRNEELASNRLRSDLNIRYHGNLGTDPVHDGIFRFDSTNSNHRIGIEFDAPLVRRAERNAYRASQIFYQRARRSWMSTRDQVVRELRLDIRQLNLIRRQFEINRVQLVIAARRVEETENEQRSKRTSDSSNTLLLLQSLDFLLSAKNSLIQNWVQYQTFRMSLYLHLDLMDIDSRGVWLNEFDDLKRGIDGPSGDDDPLPPLPPDSL